MSDPRGSESEATVMGAARARSVVKYLQSLGVEAELSWSSMGEELATGVDEAGWARDRRVDLSER